MTDNGTEASLSPEIEDYIRQLSDATVTASRLVEGLSDEQLTWRPAEDRWSIVECVAHLNSTSDAYLPVIDRALRIARKKNLVGQGPYRYGFFINWFVRTMEPPPRKRFRSPRVFSFEMVRAVSDVFPDFLARQEALIARVRESHGLHLAKVKLSSPASRLIRMSLGQCFALVAAHERRHLWQAARVRDEMEV